MSRGEWITLLVIAFISLWRLSAMAGRLDRVHVRRDLARKSLLVQLSARSIAVKNIINEPILSGTQNQQLSDALEALAVAATGSISEYLTAESDMTAVLSDVFGESSQQTFSSSQHLSLIKILSDSCKRVALARRFHNDSVGAAQLLHKRKLVRYLRLAGNTPFPTPIDMDDAVPRGLEEL